MTTRKFHIVIENADNTPMIAHNGQMANPLNKFAKELKQLSGLRNKTDEIHHQMAEIEFNASLYLDKKGNITWETRCVEANLVEGARKSKEGKLALAGAYLDPTLKFQFDGYQGVQERWDNPEECIIAVPVRVGQSKIVRTRPIFHAWNMEYNVTINDELVKPESLERWIIAGGTQVGLGDWRPRYGRFHIVSLEEVKIPKKSPGKRTLPT